MEREEGSSPLPLIPGSPTGQAYTETFTVAHNHRVYTQQHHRRKQRSRKNTHKNVQNEIETFIACQCKIT